MSHLLPICMLLFVLCTPPASAIIDCNNNGAGNGMSDLWERQYNDGQLFEDSFLPDGDADGDGWTNAQEATTGTNPRSGTSPEGVLRPEISVLSDVWLDLDGDEIDEYFGDVAIITWPIIAGKKYTLQISTDLTNGSWLTVEQASAYANGVRTCRLPFNQEERSFWRVAIDDVDSDGDNMTDAEEYGIGADPHLTDTDGDGMDDDLEYLAGFTATNSDQNSNGSRDGWDDFDGDGYSNMEELAARTNPHDAQSRPDGISTDTLLVRNYLVTASYRGDCGSKRFAFPELYRDAGQVDELHYRPSYFLRSEQKTNQDQDVKEDSFVRLGNLSMDYFESRQKGDDSSNTTEWSRQGPAFNSSAPTNYFPSETNSTEYAIRLQARQLQNGLEVATTNEAYTSTYNHQNNPESQTSEETGTYFAFPFFYKIGQNLTGSVEELELSEVTEDTPTTHSVFESYLGSYTLAGQPIGFGFNSIKRWNISSSSIVLSNEYTDAMLEDDVDEALQTYGNSGPNGGYGNAPIPGNDRVSPRGIADFGRTHDHADVLKQDAVYHLSAAPTTAGVKKMVFIWPEIHTSDPSEGVSAVQPAPILRIMRAEKVSASSFPVGQSVQTSLFQLPHPENPGFVNLGGTSSLECPDVLRVSYGPSGGNTPEPPMGSVSFHVDRSYQDLTVTLESSGSATLKLWCIIDGTFSEVPLPYTLKREQKAGKLSKPESFLIQGITTGNNTLSLKQAGQQIAFKSLKIIDLDLDTDSDNSGTVDGSLSEDQIENVADAPGKVLVYEGASDADSDKVLNRDDMDNAGSFIPVELKLNNLSETERVVFQYSQAGIGTDRKSGCLRLWKKDGTQARSGDDLVTSGGNGYTVGELGLSTGGSLTLYVESAAPVSDELLISISGAGVEDAVKFSPVSVEHLSRDKYLAGSIAIPEGWDNLEVEFVNTASQENLGRYGNLTGGGTTKIYNSVDDVMSDADIASGSQPVSQKVWFVRESGKPRKISYYTCFNSVGAVEIRLFRNNLAVATFKHTLTTAEDFADTIRYVNNWVIGVGFELSGGGGTIPMAMGAPAANGFDDEIIEHFTRAALIPFFNVINQVEGLASAATGLFDGARAGINDDWKFLMLVKSGLVAGGDWAWQQVEAELIQWRDDPLKRAAELKEMAACVCKDWVFEPLMQKRRELCSWDGFKNASWKYWKSVQGTAAKGWTVTRSGWKDVVSGLIDWGNDFCDRMMTGAEQAHWEGVSWARTKLDDDINEYTRQASYTFGYTFGYISEQVAVGALSAGTVKVAQVATKGGVHLAANLARRTAANVAVRAHFLKRLLAEATKLPDDLVAAYQRGFTMASTGPTGEAMDKCAMHMMQEAADAGRLVWREYVDNIVGKTNIRQFVKQGSEGIIERRMTQLLHIMGGEFSPEIARNFLKVADEVLLVPTPGGNVDEFFEAFFRAFDGNPGLMVNADIGATFSKSQLSADGKATLKKFLSDPNAGKLWEIDVPAIVDNEPAIPHNYWVRGILGELAIYKRFYKNAGYAHFPTAPAFDLKSAAEYVQIKTLKNPDGAIGAMKKAVDALAVLPNPPDGLKLHILKKPGSGSDQLEAALQAYINDPDGNILGRVQLIIQEFDLVP